MVKPNFLEKFSFGLAHLIGTPTSLLLHTLIFGVFLTLRYFNLVSNGVLFILAAAACLEAIYMAIFLQVLVKNNTKTLNQLKGNIGEIKEEQEATQKLMINMLHMVHQLKSIQHDLEVLKKHTNIKSSGNHQRPRIHS